MSKTPFPHDPIDIFAALNKAKVRYMVVGGVAVIFHGAPRTTFDTDLAVDLETDNLQAFERVMKRLGFVAKASVSIMGLADPKTRRQWTQTKGMLVFAFEERKKPFRTVDVMVRPIKGFDALYRKRVIKRDRGVTVPLLPLPALMKMKKQAGRLQDLEDVEWLGIVREKTSKWKST